MEKKENFFKKAFKDMAESAKAQHYNSPLLFRFDFIIFVDLTIIYIPSAKISALTTPPVKPFAACRKIWG